MVEGKESQRIEKIAVWIFVLAMPLVLFDWFLPFSGLLTIGNDYVIFAIQHQLELQYSIEHGSFPLYAPGFAGGKPAATLTLGQVFHPISFISRLMPGYWYGYALEWNTAFRLAELAATQLLLLNLLLRLRFSLPVAFFLSFITVYNLKMLDLFRYGASHENYVGYLLLCTAMGFYFLRKDKRIAQLAVVASTYLLISGGHPQMMYFGLLGAVIAGLAIPFVFSAICTEIHLDRATVLRYYGGLTLLCMAGTLLAAIYILPFYFDFMADSPVRAGAGYQWSLTYGDNLRGALGSLFAPLTAAVSGAFGSSPIIVLIVLTPLLLFCGIRVPRVILVLWSICVLVFLCSVGSDTPVHFYFWKYFPLASNFRVPGRIGMVLPFLFLLILAWFFRATGQDQRKLHVARISVSAGTIVTLLSIAAFVGFNWYSNGQLSPASAWTPARIFGDEFPAWLHDLIFWIGLTSLILVVAYQTTENTRLRFAHTVAGILICVALVAQGAIQMRYGTWVEPKRYSWTMKEMNAGKKLSLDFRGYPGSYIESASLTEQMSKSFIETDLAKFYRNTIFASSHSEAYRLLSTTRRPDSVVVEHSSRGGVERSPAGIDDVNLVYSSYNKLIFQVDARAQGYFVLSYPLSTNWRSSVNGSPVETFRANGNSTSVRLDAGQHQVVFEYISVSTLIGAAISLLSLLFVAIFFSGVFFRGRLRKISYVVVTGLSLSTSIMWYKSLYGGDNLDTAYKWNSADFPSNDNLAYGRMTRMSSIWSEQMPYLWYAGRAVDGDRKSKGFTTNERDRQSWWQVFLGRRQILKEISIYPSLDIPGNMTLEIQVSDDGINFQKLKQLRGNSSNIPWRTDLSGTSALYVRLVNTEPGPLSLREVEIY